MALPHSHNPGATELISFASKGVSYKYGIFHISVIFTDSFVCSFFNFGNLIFPPKLYHVMCHLSSNYCIFASHKWKKAHESYISSLCILDLKPAQFTAFHIPRLEYFMAYHFEEVEYTWVSRTIHIGWLLPLLIIHINELFSVVFVFHHLHTKEHCRIQNVRLIMYTACVLLFCSDWLYYTLKNY